jgi:ABC-type multidrug transport system fused ATPase/permease subunit
MLTRTLPFTFVLLRMVPLLKILNGQKAIIFSRWPYLRSVADLLGADVRPTIDDGDFRFRGLTREIRLSGVSFSYRSRRKPALSSVNLVIPAGKMTAIIGESGSGKSTLVNLILRLYDPQAGTISIDGRPLTSLHLESYHRRIGSVGQDTYLFHQTVRYNIAYGAVGALSDEAVMAAAKKACAHDFIIELPEGYNTMIGERGVQLSGGQRQRLALARAIVIDPEILILDEATSALDSETEQAIQRALTEFGPGRTVIVIAHRPSTIRDADQVVVLKNSKVVEVRPGKPVPV